MFDSLHLGEKEYMELCDVEINKCDYYIKFFGKKDREDLPKWLLDRIRKPLFNTIRFYWNMKDRRLVNVAVVDDMESV